MARGFRSSQLRFYDAVESNYKRAEASLEFGVNFLDRALDRILTSDLILIGARSGSGKTEMVTHIARHNALMGQRVFFFALEADEFEIENRILFPMAVEKYYKDPNHSHTSISYPKFVLNQLGEPFEKYVDEAIEEARKKYKTLFTFYRKETNFGINDFILALEKIKDFADLIIVDHINYFDLETENENREVSEIVKTIRDIALLTKIPIILVAHFRKKDKGAKELIPDLDDFHGTSNLAKMCTKAVIIEPKFDTDSINPLVWATYIRCAKYRLCSARTRFVGLCYFSLETNTYDKLFKLGRLVKGGSEFEEITNSDLIPAWAKGNLLGMFNAKTVNI